MFLEKDPETIDKTKYNTISFPENISYGAIKQNKVVCGSSNYDGIMNAYLRNNTEYYNGNQTISVQCPKDSNLGPLMFFGISRDINSSCAKIT